MLLEGVDQPAARFKGFISVLADDAYDDTRLSDGHPAQCMVQKDGQAGPLLGSGVSQIVQELFCHRQVRLVLKRGQVAMDGVCFKSGSSDEDTFPSRRFGSRPRHDFKWTLQQGSIYGRVAHGVMVASRTMHENNGQLVLSAALGGLPGSPRQLIERLSGDGWRGVQLDARAVGMRPHELGASARRDLASVLRRRQLALTGLDLWLPPEAYSDPAHQHRAVERTAECIQLAAELGACPVCMVLPSIEAEGNLESALEAIIKMAEESGVRIADFGSAVSGTRDGSHAHGLGLDPAGLLACGTDPVAAVHAWGTDLAAARLVDLSPEGMRVPPPHAGNGRLDLLAYKVALGLSNEIDGVVVDVRQCPEPLNGLQQARSAWESIT